MVRTKDWLQQKRKHFDDSLVRANRPIISDVDEPAILLKGPNSAAFEISRGLHRESIRIARFSRAKVNPQRVWQPTPGAQADKPAKAMLAAGFELFHFEIDRAPPTRQRQCIFENVGDFADVRLDAPPVDELIVVGRHFPFGRGAYYKRGSRFGQLSVAHDALSR